MRLSVINEVLDELVIAVLSRYSFVLAPLLKDFDELIVVLRLLVSELPHKCPLYTGRDRLARDTCVHD